jgi:hypothetical protein
MVLNAERFPSATSAIIFASGSVMPYYAIFELA